MYNLSDIDSAIAARKREVYQASEARWSREGITVMSSQGKGYWLSKVKKLLNYFKPAQIEYLPTQMSPRNELHAYQTVLHDLVD